MRPLRIDLDSRAAERIAAAVGRIGEAEFRRAIRDAVAAIESQPLPRTSGPLMPPSYLRRRGTLR